MSAAWTRKEGQNPKGGLNAKGRASLKAQGQDIKAPVKSGDNPRRASFLARMAGNDGPEYKDGKPTRLLLSLNAWGASSKADARMLMYEAMELHTCRVSDVEDSFAKASRSKRVRAESRVSYA